MQEHYHWAQSLEIGDRAFATIRHKTDGTKNIHDAEIIIVRNKISCKCVDAAHENVVYEIPYNELFEYDAEFFKRHLSIIAEIQSKAKAKFLNEGKKRPTQEGE